MAAAAASTASFSDPHRLAPLALRIAAALQGLQEGGAVASSCVNQLQALAVDHPCLLISDGRPADLPSGFAVQTLPVPSLRWLRRYAHVPRQLVFILMTGAALTTRRPRRSLDLVLFHSHPPTALLASLLRRRLGCRVVMVMHGDIFDRPPGTYDPRITWWYRLWTRRAYQRADAVLALSPYMASLAVRGGARPEHVHLVPNGVDLEEIGLASPALTPESQDVLFVGRLEFNKGLDLLIQAFIRLAGRHPRLRLTCIGSPDHAFLQPLLQLLEVEQLASRVAFLPPQAREQLGVHYQRAALVVIPSRSETQSTVAMEAMAAGRAVLASDTGGYPMLVDAPATGLLFRSGDAEDLVSQLDGLITSPQRLAAMGRSAAQRHQAHFTRACSAARLRASIERIGAGLPSLDASALDGSLS